MQWLFMRLLGNLPGPLLIGSMIDTSCSLWNIECGERTSCWLYNNTQMSYLVMAFGLAFKGLGSIFFFLAWYFYRDTVNSDTKQPLEESDDVMKADF